MPNLAESLLALFAGSERAAAIMGDLTEMAARRGRLWFWIAYARTLITLGWRTPVAFICAIASVRIMWRVFPIWLQQASRHLPAQWQDGFYGQLAVASGPFLNTIAMCLWFALPFAWMRFGLRDRLTTFACVMFFSTIGVFSFRVWLMDVSSILTMLAILAALLLSRWRRPLAVLALTSVTGIASLVACFHILALLVHQNYHTFAPARKTGWLTAALALSITALVCIRLHRWLMERPASTDRGVA